jgi:hypothetical protein
MWRRRTTKSRARRLALALAILVGSGLATVPDPARAAPAQTARVTPPGTTVLIDSGAWSWFEDERVIIDAAAARLYVSAVATSPTRGEVVLGEVDLATGQRRQVSLGAAELDDHNSAAMWESPAGEVVSAWTRHHADNLIRTHRRRTDGSWLRLPPITDPSRVTYNNLYSVLAEDGPALLYDFYRGTRSDPQAMASTDAGRTWSRLGTLLRDPQDGGGTRPYVRYTSRGDRIDLIATEAHPANFRTSIYHGFIRDGILHRSDGTPLGPVGTGVEVTDLTLIAEPGPAQASWTLDITYDARTRHPIAAYSTTLSQRDHRYHVARWDGSAWSTREIAFAGRSLYSTEDHYTGLVALDPTDADHLVISTDADPTTGNPLVSRSDGVRHFELYDGRRQPSGAYAWTPLTANSTAQNIRPVLTIGRDGTRALVWLRGVYNNFSSFAMQVVGTIRRPDGRFVATSRTAPRRPVVPGIAAPPVLSTAAVPLAGRFDSHAAADLFLYRPGTARDDLIIGDDGRRPVYARLAGVTGSYRPATGDFDGDGDDDVLWHGPGTTADGIWWARGDGGFQAASTTPVRGTYTPITGDFDSDGDADILWYGAGTAADFVWTSRGDGSFAARPVSVRGSYRPAAGDFDGDGDTDIFWYGRGALPDGIWWAQGGRFVPAVAPAVNGFYLPIAADVEGDGDDDIFWYAPGTNRDGLWRATGGRFSSAPTPQVTGTYVPVAADIDASGGDDIVWYAPGGAADNIWWSDPRAFPVAERSPLAM